MDKTKFEELIKDAYGTHLSEMPTFTKEMGEHIQKELTKMAEQAKEYLKNKESFN